MPAALIAAIAGLAGAGATIGQTIYSDVNQPSQPSITAPPATPPKPAVSPTQLSTAANNQQLTSGFTGAAPDYLNNLLQGGNGGPPIDWSQLQGFIQPGVSG